MSRLKVYNVANSAWEYVSGGVPSQIDRAGGAAGDYVARVKLTADTQYRFIAGLDGSSVPGLSFGGGGTAAPDVRLWRHSPGVSVIDSNGAATQTVFAVHATAAQASTLFVTLTADDYPRAALEGDATLAGLSFGPGGTVAPDVRLWRSAAKTLTLDDAAGGGVGLSMPGNGYIVIGGTFVLGTRKTGWAAASGTASRATFATDTVTLINLARTVKALIDDLFSWHGLIGT